MLFEIDFDLGIPKRFQSPQDVLAAKPGTTAHYASAIGRLTVFTMVRPVKMGNQSSFEFHFVDSVDWFSVRGKKRYSCLSGQKIVEIKVRPNKNSVRVLGDKFEQL